jgi:hypothetical protein
VVFALPEPIVVGGEAFIEPDMAPITAGDEVAKPLVCKFVSNEAVAIEEVACLLGEEAAMVERGEAGVFHASPVIVVNSDLTVLCPRVGNADLLFKELHHPAGVPEEAWCVWKFVWGCPELEREIPVSVFHFFEISGDEGDEIVHVRLVLEPMELEFPVLVFGVGESLAVGESDHTGWDMAGEFGGEFFDGMVEAREPVTGFDGFSLGPQVIGGIAHLFGPEVEASTWFCLVIDADGGLFADGDGWIEREDDLRVGEMVSESRFRAPCSPDIQINGIESEFGKRGSDGLEVEDAVASDCAFFEIWGDVQFEVKDVDFAIGRVFAIGGGIGACGGGCRGTEAA